ncbi:MAG TPA: hypothetical protein VEH06_00620 [Candidatus Bathyarchaeia archaeon]|nr:hypothetical protein [Candidatus Bathyarchaeia archaeon]
MYRNSRGTRIQTRMNNYEDNFQTEEGCIIICIGKRKNLQMSLVSSPNTTPQRFFRRKAVCYRVYADKTSAEFVSESGNGLHLGRYGKRDCKGVLVVI